jgi:hypothetical protein
MSSAITQIHIKGEALFRFSRLLLTAAREAGSWNRCQGDLAEDGLSTLRDPFFGSYLPVSATPTRPGTFGCAGSAPARPGTPRPALRGRQPAASGGRRCRLGRHTGYVYGAGRNVLVSTVFTPSLCMVWILIAVTAKGDTGARACSRGRTGHC